MRGQVFGVSAVVVLARRITPTDVLKECALVCARNLADIEGVQSRWSFIGWRLCCSKACGLKILEPNRKGRRTRGIHVAKNQLSHELAKFGFAFRAYQRLTVPCSVVSVDGDREGMSTAPIRAANGD
jgi:hypothetical protein